MPSQTEFKGVGQIGDLTPAEMIKTNLIHYLNWSFLQIGAYFNINIPQSGAYGGDESRLRPVSSPYETDGKVWEGFRGNWVWESGLSQATQPIAISGVFVDNVFVSPSAFYVDYPNGQIVFAEARATSSIVRAEYSTKWINIIDANEVPWFRSAQYKSHKIDTNQFFNFGSGDRHSMSKTRLQLPAVAVEMGRKTLSPYSLGFGHYVNNQVIFHVLGENSFDVERISDILSNQHEKTIFMFDVNLAIDSGVIPLNYQGSIKDGAMTFPQLTEDRADNGYRWTKLRFFEIEEENTQIINNNLYLTNVNANTEVVLALW